MWCLFWAWQMPLWVLDVADWVRQQASPSSLTQFPDNFCFSSNRPYWRSCVTCCYVSSHVSIRKLRRVTVRNSDHRRLPVVLSRLPTVDFTAAVVEALICCLLLLLLLGDLVALQWNYLAQQLAQLLAALKLTLGNNLFHRSFIDFNFVCLISQHFFPRKIELREKQDAVYRVWLCFFVKDKNRPIDALGA